MRRERTSLFLVLLALIMGLSSELYIRFPALGTIAMLDLFAYFVALPIIACQWSFLGKNMRRIFLWGFAWTVASMLANLFNFVTGKYWLKCVALASSSWALMAVAYLLLKRNAKCYLWYLVGAGIGGWIALYHFRSGSLEGFATNGDYGGAGYGLEYLMDKQIYPIVARGVFWGCVLPFFLLWKKIPIFAVIGAAFFAGVWLLFNGGSRSHFGMFCASAGAAFLVSYGKSFFRRIAKHPIMMLFYVGLGVSLLFGSYAMLAKSGTIGEGEQTKYEGQFGEEGYGAVEGRAHFSTAFRDAFESAGLGKGWHIRNHSVMANSLACEGVVGFLFWVYFYLMVFWWVCKRLPYSGKYAAFIVLMMLSAVWDVFGSPFGARHKFFVLMVFIALCKDSPFYGIGSIFDERMLSQGGRG